MDRGRAVALLSIFLVAACSTPAKTTAPVSPTAPGATPTAELAVPSLDIEQPGLTPTTGQTDTDWGPIWDTLPEGFPTPLHAEPAEPASGTGPVSAAWTVPSAGSGEPRAIAQEFVDAFSAAGYGGGRDGPLEDGAYTAWASNGYGCDMLVTATPKGDETLVTVLYGAGCPFSWPET